MGRGIGDNVAKAARERIIKHRAAFLPRGKGKRKGKKGGMKREENFGLAYFRRNHERSPSFGRHVAELSGFFMETSPGYFAI